MRLKLIFVMLFITVVYADSDEQPLIEISNGWLLGTHEKSYNGRTFTAYEGIPYAKPPVRDLRFQPPEEPYDWTGTWVANTKHTCVQTSFEGLIGDEDCLYLNVYVPRTKPSKSDNLNVIVHIHGGGFMMMSSHAYSGPKYLMDEDVILVTMNYRLGVFGFLSTEDELIPGNNGLKDQVLSLKWIQKNIKYFGGNPKSVTLTGMSAGGASVHLHYLSPLSKGLFHRGVSQSGTALSPWVIQEGALEHAKLLAQTLGCNSKNSTFIIDCLQPRSANEISEAVSKISSVDGFDRMMFSPVVERVHENAFISEQPLRILRNQLPSDVPWVTSITKEEGQFMLAVTRSTISEIYEKFETLAPYMLMYNYINLDYEKATISNKIRKHYLKGSPSYEDVVTMVGDRMFNSPADRSAKLQAKINKSPVYFYIFGYRGQHTFTEYFLKDADHIGTSHGDDAQYYFNTANSEETLSESDEKMKKIFVAWLVDFANNKELKVKDVTWKPVTSSDQIDFLYIHNPHDIHMESAETMGSSNFWSKLPLSENDNVLVIRDEL